MQVMSRIVAREFKSRDGTEICKNAPPCVSCIFPRQGSQGSAGAFAGGESNKYICRKLRIVVQAHVRHTGRRKRLGLRFAEHYNIVYEMGAELEELVPSQERHNFRDDAWRRLRGHRADRHTHRAQEQVGRSVIQQKKRISSHGATESSNALKRSVGEGQGVVYRMNPRHVNVLRQFERSAATQQVQIPCRQMSVLESRSS